MSTEGDRRAPGASRVAFDALVEVGGELGPSFEAQAIDLSQEGMHLRTAYLPEIGQPLSFRFDAGPGRQIVATGEVAWKQEAGKGGEFGVRFTNLDSESVASLGKVLGVTASPAMQPPGSRVRLHIDGLGSPMRARVKEASGTEITAFSELGFLQVGKQLELEDTQTGNKRPASIDRVEVEIDQASRVPQLVVTLRYDDAVQMESEPVDMGEDGQRDATPEPTVSGEGEEPHMGEQARMNAPAEAQSALPSASPIEDDASFEEVSGKMRGTFARGAAKVGPAFTKMMNRAKVTLALLAAKRRAQLKDSLPIPLRRMTAPPPGGALHASGRKVVRSEPEIAARMEVEPGSTKKLVTKRRAIMGAAMAVAIVLAFVALRKPTPHAPLASAPPLENVVAAPVLQSPAAPVAVDPMTPALAAPLSPPDPASLSAAARDDREIKAPKRSKPATFGNGSVVHGNVLHLKMDGPIEKIEGAQQPTGFTVVIPSRRSLEAAGPLASRDSRIASIRVSNDPTGAELAVTFKDGVPNYQVRARGDMLEIALAPIGQLADAKSASANRAAQAKHNENPTKPHGNGHKAGPSQKR